MTTETLYFFNYQVKMAEVAERSRLCAGCLTWAEGVVGSKGETRVCKEALTVEAKNQGV